MFFVEPESRFFGFIRKNIRKRYVSILTVIFSVADMREVKKGTGTDRRLSSDTSRKRQASDVPTSTYIHGRKDNLPDGDSE